MAHNGTPDRAMRKDGSEERRGLLAEIPDETPHVSGQCPVDWERRFLHLCADAGIVVVSYGDQAEGILAEHSNGGHFTQVTLKPRVVVAPGCRLETAERLHQTASERCFIRNSVNFPVEHDARVIVDSAT